MSAARNAGLAAATGEWICFLDADDWLAPAGLSRLLARAIEAPEATVVVGMASRVSRLGRSWSYPGRDLSDPFCILATHCAFPIHSSITRRDALVELGGFDEDLPSSEDWDLWQRLARAGHRFVQTPAHVALYRARLGSLSRQLPQAAEQGLRVMRRAHGPDPRVPHPDPRYAEGAPAHGLAAHELYYVLWAAARDIADGGEGLATARLLEPDLDVDFEPTALGELLAGGMADMLACRPGDLGPDWTTFEPKLRAVLDQVYTGESRARLKALAVAVIKARCNGARPEDPDVLQLDGKPRPKPTGGDRDFLTLQVRWGSCTVGLAALPQLGGLTGDDVADAVLEQVRGWPLKAALKARRPWRSRAFWSAALRAGLDPRGLGLRTQWRDRSAIRRITAQRTRHAMLVGLQAAIARDLAPLRLEAAPSGHAPARAALAAASRERAPPGLQISQLEQAVSARGGRAAQPELAHSWDEFFAAEDPWNYGGSDYERLKYEDTLELIPPMPQARALEVACAEGHFTPKLAERVGALLATDISTTALQRAQRRCEGRTNVSFQPLDLLRQPLPGQYDLIVCSEVLYYAGRRLSQVAAKLTQALQPGGVLVMAHANFIADDPASTGFDWGHSEGAHTIAETFGQTPGLVLEHEIHRPLYRVQRFRKVGQGEQITAPVTENRPLQVHLEPAVAKNVIWGGGESRIEALRRESALAVPVLIYHRISPAPQAGLEAYCVTPEMFEAQIAWLRQRGYWGVTPEGLAEALARNRPVPGRPVMITFDDGYADFAEHALPLLDKHDMPATLFIPAERVGGSADWDASHGPAARLLGWTDIVELSRRGVVIESHAASHQPLTRLNMAEVYRELLTSREMIASATGRAPISICYPYGATDPVVERAASECGYQLGFSTGYGIASLADNPLRLPRIEITNKDAAASLARKLGRPPQRNPASERQAGSLARAPSA